MKKTMLTQLIIPFAAALLLVGGQSVARADFMPAFTGNTGFGMPDADADGTVSYAVYDNRTDPDGDSNWTNNFSMDFDTAIDTTAGGFVVDEAADFVYFFQVANTDLDDSAEDTIISFLAPTPESVVTGFSYVDGFVFTDTDGAVGPSGNRALGTESVSIDTPGDGSSDGSGYADSVDFVDNASAEGLAANTEGMGMFESLGTHVNADGVLFRFGDRLTIDGFSSIMFYTSNKGPVHFAPGTLTASEAFGDVPSTPLPASLALLFTGVPALPFLLRRRRSKAA